eukprot:CAMPEP_0197116706 /NCGR_PEP_ID=MMETSP1390-20130617/302_1 /TAXON_ID=38833 /ORGANISM="Micromonas sp., Strain CCMP2099" /LENGTH=250 /DNA_ID=CAMNT_0042557923 /DNA_START=112 /DNA_END=864 /DNA_ORIENTATION=+
MPRRGFLRVLLLALFSLNAEGANITFKDYEGNLCTEDYPVLYFPNPYELLIDDGDLTRYMVNPNDPVYDYGGVKSMCLKDCPSPVGRTAAPLNWVCNYPDSFDGRGMTGMTRAEWAAADYDYFASLNATFKTDSYNNKGPCYPVLLHTVNTYETCTFYGDQDTAAQTELNTILVAASIVPGLEHNLGTAVSALSAIVSEQITPPPSPPPPPPSPPKSLVVVVESSATRYSVVTALVVSFINLYITMISQR